MSTSSQISGNSVVIVGSGVAGSALAFVLARDGRHVTVIERSMVAKERIKGEGMQPGGMDVLRILGLEECAAEAEAVSWSGLIWIDKATGREARLPFPSGSKGFSCKNHLFVQALRRRAQEEKSCTYIEASVRDVIEEDGGIKGVIYCRKNSDKKEELRADLTFVCDGSNSWLRKINIADKPVKHGTFIGFLYDANLKGSEDCEYGCMFLRPRNSLFTYPVNRHEKRTMCYVRGDWPTDLSEHVKKQIETVPDDVAALMVKDIDQVKLSPAHAFHSHSKAEFRKGVITIGDALNQRHPVSAAGMSVALKDIIKWRDLLREIPNLGDMDAMREAHTRFLSKRKAHPFVVNLNGRLFADMAYPIDDEEEFDRDCKLEYLLWSKKARRDMAAILPVKETRPWVLLYHLAISPVMKVTLTEIS